MPADHHEEANGTQDHVEPGTPIAYGDAPPAFGQHYNVPDPMARKFYTSGDRPELGTLVHNLEHGYTVLWYDETAAKDNGTMDQIRAIAAKFEGTGPARQVQGRAVDLVDDGEGVPRRRARRVHPLVGRRRRDGTAGKQGGVWQYCSAPSGAALQSFMDQVPLQRLPRARRRCARPRRLR